MEKWFNILENKIEQVPQKVVDRYMLTILTFLLLLGFFIVSRNLSLHGDEYHFYPTILQFSSNPFFETLYGYNEIISPLTFILYSAYGKLVNTELTTLRYFSVCISGAACYSFYILTKHFTRSAFYQIVLTTLFVLNPYFLSLSVYVYTDICTVLFVIWTIIFLAKENLLGYGIAATFAMLARQHCILIFLGFLLYFCYNHFRLQHKTSFAFILTTIIAFILPFGLFIYWKGLSPAGAMTAKMNTFGLQYELTALTAYLFSIGIYAFPIFLFHYKKILTKGMLLWTSMAILFYFFFPITAAICSQQDGIFTIGLAHKFISSMIPSTWIQQFIQLVFFIFGSLSIIVLIKKSINNIKTNSVTIMNALVLTIVLFLLVMPLSFQIWEKYILIILPQLLLSSLLFKSIGKTS